ncbi:MAG TPA: hypothetical protein VNY73_07475 [Bacteroidia bacterium]|jgi:hypothetical protein|nr:hypothetical protein [Bacteroidia bacterium]
MRLLSLTFLMAVLFCANAQTPGFFITPGVSIGYTFGAKINYGFTLDMGYALKEKGATYKAGLSLGYYLVKTKHSTHRLRSFNLLAENNFMSVKIGVGRARNPWGYGRRNRCIVHGYNYDVSFTLPGDPYSPWVGIKRFVYKPSQWAWFYQPYTSLYVQEKYTFLQQDNTGKNPSIFK